MELLLLFAQASPTTDLAPWGATGIVGAVVGLLIWFVRHVMAVTIPQMQRDHAEAEKEDRAAFSAAVHSIQEHCQTELDKVGAVFRAEMAAERELFQRAAAAAHELFRSESLAARTRNHDLINQLQGIVGKTMFADIMEQRKSENV